VQLGQSALARAAARRAKRRDKATGREHRFRS